MRKFLPYLFLITTLLVGVGVFAVPYEAHAQAGAAAGAVLNWVTGGTDFVYGILGKILWFVTVPISGGLLWLVGAMIDGVLLISSNPDFYDSPAISSAWGILRDIANMLFIFILIFHGIQVILNMGNLSTIKRTIGGVILAAIFINFSLFVTKVVIDVSNITAAWFVQGTYNIGGEESISGSVRSTLQMSKLAESPVGRGATELKNLSAQSFATGIALTVLNLIAAYVFFQVFFLLLGRLVTFMFLLITAPIGFVGFLLPQLKDYGSKWWKELSSQAMLAPVFFLMLYITLYIVDRTDTALFGATGMRVDPVTGSSFSPTNYIMFAVIIAMLFKIIDITKEYSGELGGKVSGLLKSTAMFATGTLAMGTIGKAASAAQGNASLQRWAGKSAIGSLTLKGVKATAGSSFGVSSSVKDLGISKIPGAKNAFKGAEKGYSGKVEQEEKDEKDFAKLLGKGLAGAQNRQAYAERMESGLYAKVTKNGLGVGATVGGALGVVGGLPGMAVGAAVGGMAGKAVQAGLNTGVGKAATGAIGGLFAKIPGSGIASRAASAAFEDRGIKEAKEDILKDANKEYAKEAGKEAEKIKKATIDEDPELKKLKEDEVKLNQDIEKADVEAKNFVKKKTEEISRLRDQEKKAEETLKTFDVSSKTVGGIKLDDKSFDAKRAEATKALEDIQKQIDITELNASLGGETVAGAALLNKRLEIQKQIKTRGDKAIEEAVEKMELAGIKLEKKTLEGINEVIKEGNKKRSEDEGEKLKKQLEKLSKLEDEKPAEKPEEKGGDKPKGK